MLTTLKDAIRRINTKYLAATPTIRIREVPIDADIEIKGHVFHGLKDIQAAVEKSLHEGYSQNWFTNQKPRKPCKVHVGELWTPYPCFDSDDYANENRCYRNFIFRSHRITRWDLSRMAKIPSRCNDCRVHEDTPAWMLPMVFYCGDGLTMLVAERK